MECPICFDRVHLINVCTTECGHTFHLTCFMQSATSRCPLCRFDIMSQTYPTIVDDDDDVTTEVETLFDSDDEYSYSDDIDIDNDNVHIRNRNPFRDHIVPIDVVGPPLMYVPAPYEMVDSPVSVIIDMDESAQFEFQEGPTHFGIAT